LNSKISKNLFAGQCGTQCEKIVFSQATLMQHANCSHWNIYAECELSRFSQAVNGNSARIPETNENFERTSKIQTGL
jgi:hypothetical protein